MEAYIWYRPKETSILLMWHLNDKQANYVYGGRRTKEY